MTDEQQKVFDVWYQLEHGTKVLYVQLRETYLEPVIFNLLSVFEKNSIPCPAKGLTFGKYLYSFLAVNASYMEEEIILSIFHKYQELAIYLDNFLLKSQAVNIGTLYRSRGILK